MAPFGKILSYPGNPRVQRAQVIAALNGLEIHVPEAPEFQFGVTTQTPEFLAKWPLGKVPVFEGADGFCLAEGAAIALYLAASGPRGPQLLGGDSLQAKAKIAEWTLFTETELIAHATPWLLVLLKFMPFSEATHGEAAARFQRALGRVEAAVKDGRKYLVGDQLTLADLEVASVLFFASGFLLDADMRKTAPAAIEYLRGIAAIPEFAKVFGEYKPCEKRVTGA